MSAHSSATAATAPVQVRPLRGDELDTADRILRLAFGTFLALPQPLDFMGDANYVHTRWRAAPGAAFAAEHQGKLIGSNFATPWGSVGFFGPLTVHPEHWGHKAAQALMEPVMACFERWDTVHAGLHTFAHSPRHVRLYQTYGFWPQQLSMVMAKPVAPTDARRSPALRWTAYAQLPAEAQASALRACAHVTDALCEGLDLRHEIVSVQQQALGDTLLLWEDDLLVGLAVCHGGPGSEAGTDAAYVKFGAVRPGSKAARDFDGLLGACEDWAAQRRLRQLWAGVNTAREHAYRHLLGRGFRTQIQGVCMAQSTRGTHGLGYNRPGAYVIDDWR